MNRKTIFAIAAFSLILAGCGSQSGDSTPKKEAESAKLVQVNGGEGLQLEADSVKFAGVTLETAGDNKLTSTLQPTGEVQTTDTGAIQVTSRLPGKITDALVSVGQRLHKGQPIAYVDSVDLTNAESAYQTALSHETLAKHQLEQQHRMAGFGSLSEQAVEDAHRASAAGDAAVRSDEAQLKVDRLALDSTKRLVAMGEITKKPVEDAQNAYAQAQATRIQANVTLNSTKKNLDRTKILYQGGVFSLQQFEDAETAYNSAVAASDQSVTAENLAKEELNRQQTIFKQNLNGATSLQGAESKLAQDNHQYQNDLTAQGLSHTEYRRALTVRQSGIPINSALQQAQDSYDEAVVTTQSAANTLKLYGVTPGMPFGEIRNGHVVIPVEAPMDGIVSARTMVVGQVIDPTVSLIRLVNLDKVIVDAQVYEQNLASVALGDSVKVLVSAFPNRTFTGKVQWISSELSTDTRTATVRTVLDNPGWTLRPGMYASVQIGTKLAVNAISVPNDAVMQDGDKQIVYVDAGNNRYIKREVKAGELIGGRVPIQSGLAKGDKVVVGGNLYLLKEQEQLDTEKASSK